MSYWDPIHNGAKVIFETDSSKIHPRWSRDYDFGGSGVFSHGHIVSINKSIFIHYLVDGELCTRDFPKPLFLKKKGQDGYPYILKDEYIVAKPKRIFYVELEEQITLGNLKLPKGFVSKACKADWIKNYSTIALLDVNPDPNKDPKNAFQVSTLECFKISKTTYYSKRKKDIYNG